LENTFALLIALKPKLKNELQRLEKLYKTSCYSYILGIP
jgi:hypothetical protein